MKVARVGLRYDKGRNRSGYGDLTRMKVHMFCIIVFEVHSTRVLSIELSMGKRESMSLEGVSLEGVSCVIPV